ncbi:nuclear transport factor 2 family protein [Micromonospora sp. KLBMP9576]|uniref:nuclear transport factor 2 family protein n=1 Tax=Micromonospora sp. KLBMP9576 TaxID=3424769 RepID=UPI003D944252
MTTQQEASLAPSEHAVKERVLTYYQLVDAGDVARLVALFDPTATYHRPGYEPLCGHDALRRFYLQDRVIDRGAHKVDRFVVDGAEVGVHGTFRGVLRDGREITLRFADFFSLTPQLTFLRRDTFFFAPLV